MRQIVAAAIGIALLLATEIGDAVAQHAGGIAVCLAACTKSDKPCQDRCVPARSLQDAAKACIANCRNQVTGPDFIVEMTRCISSCLGETSATQ